MLIFTGKVKDFPSFLIVLLLKELRQKRGYKAQKSIVILTIHTINEVDGFTVMTVSDCSEDAAHRSRSTVTDQESISGYC